MKIYKMDPVIRELLNCLEAGSKNYNSFSCDHDRNDYFVPPLAPGVFWSLHYWEYFDFDDFHDQDFFGLPVPSQEEDN